MFWKLAFTLAVVLLLAGRTSVLRHPLARLLLPRSWSARLLSAVPDRPAKKAEPTKETESDSKLSRRIYIALVILASVAIATWIVTRALIYRETPPLP